ncbi:MAG: HNH endonuclease signature motif containing protein [Clostridium sp.]|uniref:HNH endonuclease signature motif containing protein n=1 Tax=Clostridium sp. TaxID=1506 RepID=UPI002904CAAB|nr:HNH endonuclease signature motif containing protein [Clostridium sp.]MDU1229686.1 HNH endonuclease signature motif containing protein [Clostridium sp.]
MRAYNEQTFVNEIRNKTDWKDDNLSSHRQLIKEYLEKECNHRCFFCGSYITGADVTIEHIISKSKYNTFTYKPENLILCCKECNTLKSEYYVLNKKYKLEDFNSWDDYPSRSDEYKIIHPYYDIYSQYLKRVGIIYEPVGTSMKGLKTIEAYRLDRLTLAERNASEEKDTGILFEILRDTQIDTDKTKEIMNEYFNTQSKTCSQPQYELFDRFVNNRLYGSKAFTSDIINNIEALNESNFRNLNIFYQNYLNSGNIKELGEDVLKDSLGILSIIKKIFRRKDNIVDIKCLCNYNFNEIILFWNQERFKKEVQRQVMFGIKIANITAFINMMGIKEKEDELINEILELIKYVKEELIERSA